MSPSESAANYGQEFVYEDPRACRSELAAYEPGTGADENPMRMPSFHNGPKQLLIPQEKFYMEEPFGESFSWARRWAMRQSSGAQSVV